MPKKKIKPIDELRAGADSLLEEIGFLSRAIETRETECGRQVDAIRAEFAPAIEFDRAALAEKASALLKLMRSGKLTLFERSDVIYLGHGSLIRKVDKKHV
ncbi:MAG: hypothetical protein U1D99_04120, partial [Candidatus Omnitrophota bacterium]|nr:hypothetical protein [Candidatus Omnitrophota bacterium]